MRHDATTDETVWLARLLVLIAVGLALNALLGPLVLDGIEYRYSDPLINQAIGLDAVALLGAAPAALIAAFLTAHLHPAGPVIAFIPATFAACCRGHGRRHADQRRPQCDHRCHRDVCRRSDRVHRRSAPLVSADVSRPSNRALSRPARHC